MSFKLWEIEDLDLKSKLVSTYLNKFGELKGYFSTKYSEIYTFENHNNFYIAKAPKIDSSLSTEKIKFQILKFIEEVNSIYKVSNYSLIVKFGYIEIILGVPFLIYAKKDMTLRDAIEEHTFSEVDAITVLYQIICALDYCVNKNIYCHQDLKPDNVFLSAIDKNYADGQGYPFKYLAYVADLGMANAGWIFNRPEGSRPYMPIEQYNNIGFYDLTTYKYTFSKVDTFALGVHLYEMLTGGIHPIGERTSDVWPNSILGNKWGSERIWKKWASSDQKIKYPEKIKNQTLLKLIEDCLQTNFLNRPSYELIKQVIIEELRAIDIRPYQTLLAYIQMINDAETVNTEAGWPYMDKLVNDINNYFDNL